MSEIAVKKGFDRVPAADRVRRRPDTRDAVEWKCPWIKDLTASRPRPASELRQRDRVPRPVPVGRDAVTGRSRSRPLPRTRGGR